MNKRPQSIIASLVFMQLAILPAAPPAEDAATPPLPVRSAWMLHYDVTLNGEVKPVETGVRWDIIAHNNRFYVDSGEGWVVNGEFVDARSSVLTIRQDGAKGFVAVYSGQRTEDRVISGTWFNTKGQSGDFKLTREE